MSGILLVLGYTLRTVSLDLIRISAGPLRGILFFNHWQQHSTGEGHPCCFMISCQGSDTGEREGNRTIGSVFFAIVPASTSTIIHSFYGARAQIRHLLLAIGKLLRRDGALAYGIHV